MFRSAAIVLAALAIGAQAVINVSTPTNDGNINLCDKVTFDISGDSPGPYYGYIVSGEDPCGPALKDLGKIDKSFTWTVDVQLAEGKTFMLAVENEGEEDGYSGKLAVKGSNTACIASNSAHTSTHPSSTGAPNNAANDPADASAAPRGVAVSLSLVSLVSVAAFALAL